MTREEFKAGDVLVCDLPWIDPASRWSFAFIERCRPQKAGAGVSGTELYKWPRDLSGEAARVYAIDADARTGRTTGGATTFPIEHLRLATLAASVKIGGGAGRTSRVCAVNGCGRTYAGTAEPAQADAAGLSTTPDRAGRLALCRRHRIEALGAA